MERDNRIPLKKGTPIAMKNNAVYLIGDLIGRGGISLVYSAETEGGIVQSVIKEFFPAPDSSGRTYAARNNCGQVVCPSNPGSPDFNRFQKAKELFEEEGIIGGEIASHTFQTVSFWEYNNGYAVMKKNSLDLYDIRSLVSYWETDSPLPITGDTKDIDPVWTDLPRVRYALDVVESLLSALSVVHKRNYLHLDLSYSNVFWSCQDPRTGRKGVSVISDYGSAAAMDKEEFRPSYRLMSSNGFAAPEIFEENCVCTQKTDLYSVGMLLVFLCVGASEFEWFIPKGRNGALRPARLAREINRIALCIPPDIMTRLKLLLSASIVERSYDSTEKMQVDVRQLNDIIVSSFFHPVNPDNTKAFTLYSLKSMLEGCLGVRSGWAEELRYRREAFDVPIPEESHIPISRIRFSGNESFLRSILPKEAFAFLMEIINETSNPEKAIHSILSCNYPDDWRDKICHFFIRNGFRNLIKKSECLLNNSKVFALQYKLLFNLLQDDGKVLCKCFQSCHVREYPHIGLAILIIYSLIGNSCVIGNKTKAFDKFVYDLGNPQEYFYP